VGKVEIGGADRGVILRQGLSPLAPSVTDLHGDTCLKSLGSQCVCSVAQAGNVAAIVHFLASWMRRPHGTKRAFSPS
jgi:hypothetical protein